MAIPNSSNFSLGDVITEIGLPSNSGLDDCFNNAIASGFDSLYEGSKDRLSNFRRYQHVVSNLLSVSKSPLSSTYVEFVVSNFSATNTISVNYNVIESDLVNPSTSHVLINGLQYTDVGDYSGQNVNYTTLNTNSFFEDLQLINPDPDDHIVVRCTLVSASIDTVPSPNYVDIKLGDGTGTLLPL